MGVIPGRGRSPRARPRVTPAKDRHNLSPGAGTPTGLNWAKTCVHRFRACAYSASRNDNVVKVGIRVLSLAAQLPMLALTATAAAEMPKAATPIEHLIVVTGENISFDNLFGTYRPKSGATVRNLLSEGIVTRDGS